VTVPTKVGLQHTRNSAGRWTQSTSCRITASWIKSPTSLSASALVIGPTSGICFPLTAASRRELTLAPVHATTQDVGLAFDDGGPARLRGKLFGQMGHRKSVTATAVKRCNCGRPHHQARRPSPLCPHCIAALSIASHVAVRISPLRSVPTDDRRAQRRAQPRPASATNRIAIAGGSGTPLVGRTAAG